MVVVACTNGVGHATTQASTQQGAWDVGAVVIHAYTEDVGGIRAVGANVRLRVGRDLALAGEPVLLVEYPAATNDPAARDVYVEAEHQDWSAARAIGFRVKPVHGIRLSVSFVDRNQVVYTAWTQLRGGVWQSVRIPFQDIHPNPYFQPPGARVGAPLDVGLVGRIGFAPHDTASGQLAISQFVLLPQTNAPGRRVDR